MNKLQKTYTTLDITKEAFQLLNDNSVMLISQSKFYKYV